MHPKLGNVIQIFDIEQNLVYITSKMIEHTDNAQRRKSDRSS